MTTPVRITLAPIAGLQLPDGTRVDWVEVAVLDRLTDMLMDQATDPRTITPDVLVEALGRLLGQAHTAHGRWEYDLGTITLDDGVAQVLIVAEHHEGHGWCVLLAVPDA